MACTGHVEKTVYSVYPVGERYERGKPRREKNSEGKAANGKKLN